MPLNAQSPQFCIHVKLLYALMSKSPSLQEKYFLFAPAVLNII